MLLPIFGETQGLKSLFEDSAIPLFKGSHMTLLLKNGPLRKLILGFVDDAHWETQFLPVLQDQ
jgi:hypothetical protein